MLVKTVRRCKDSAESLIAPGSPTLLFHWKMHSSLLAKKLSKRRKSRWLVTGLPRTMRKYRFWNRDVKVPLFQLRGSDALVGLGGSGHFQKSLVPTWRHTRQFARVLYAGTGVRIRSTKIIIIASSPLPCSPNGFVHSAQQISTQQWRNWVNNSGITCTRRSKRSLYITMLNITGGAHDEFWQFTRDRWWRTAPRACRLPV